MIEKISMYLPKKFGCVIPYIIESDMLPIMLNNTFMGENVTTPTPFHAFLNIEQIFIKLIFLSPIEFSKIIVFPRVRTIIVD